jgi:uncharacterized membrane protein
MKKIVYIMPLVAILISCESRTYGEISDSIPIITQTVSYNVEIKPIIESRCMGCHSVGGPGSVLLLTNYEQTKNNIDNIIDRIQRPAGASGRMPPAAPLSQSQINFFTQWKAGGLVEN